MHMPGDLEDEDRVAVGDGAAAPVADVGGDVAHAHVVDREVVLGGPAFGVPAAQHVLDVGVGEVGVVRGVRPVHGGDVGHHRRANVVVVVGGDLHAAGAFDQPGRVADEGQPHLAFGRARRGGSWRAARAAVPGRRRGSDRASAPMPGAGRRRLQAPAARRSTGGRRTSRDSGTNRDRSMIGCPARGRHLALRRQGRCSMMGSHRKSRTSAFTPISGTASRNRLASRKVRCTSRGLTTSWSASCQAESRGRRRGTRAA